MKISDTQKIQVVYRRWTLLIPVIMIIIGIILFLIAGLSNPVISVLGSGLVLIGVLTFGALLASIVGLEFAARTLAKKEHSARSFREKIEENE
ncbi:MAG: hypothetical protein ACFFDT_03830 [Candidatus Hodarchaeota archaeon]